MSASPSRNWVRGSPWAAAAALVLPACLGRSSLDAGIEGSGAAAGTSGSAGTSAAGGVAGVSGGGAGGVSVGGVSGGGVGGVSGGGAGGISGGGVGGGGTAGVGGGTRCGPDNCMGCCDAAGNCRSGMAQNACGREGAKCLDCEAAGFGCFAGFCEGPPPVCGPDTCDGCCDSMGQCRFGTSSDACGDGGGSCADCTATMEGCVAGQCEGPPPECGPDNCEGCCSNGACFPGNTDSRCGAGGAACDSCGGSGTCVEPGNYCAFIPTCGPATCPSGCCDDQGICRNGQTNAACGDGGQACADCAAGGQQCAAQGFCYDGPHCGPDNCAGCCSTGGQCRNGSASNRCGQFGAVCDNCTAKGETCQDFVCSDGSVCPTAYAGCNPGLNSPPPRTSADCRPQDLSSVETACAGQGGGPDCGSAFQDLFQTNPGCYDCMLQFATQGAYVRCLAPFLSAECNHDLSCATDCSNSTCGDCSPGDQDACEEEAFQAGGECRDFVNGYYCLEAATQGPGGDVCQFNGDLGQWLAQVGNYYCAP